jgi:hypothetical protein
MAQRRIAAHLEYKAHSDIGITEDNGISRSGMVIAHLRNKGHQ